MLTIKHISSVWQKPDLITFSIQLDGFIDIHSVCSFKMNERKYNFTLFFFFFFSFKMCTQFIEKPFSKRNKYSTKQFFFFIYDHLKIEYTVQMNSGQIINKHTPFSRCTTHNIAKCIEEQIPWVGKNNLLCHTFISFHW